MEKRQRIFSRIFKEEKVKEIESGQIRVCDFCRLYEVSSTSVYRWLNEYGIKHKKGVRMVVELESESFKRKELEEKVKELEHLLGKKQIEIEYLNMVIEAGSELLGEDLKKSQTPSLE